MYLEVVRIFECSYFFDKKSLDVKALEQSIEAMVLAEQFLSSQGDLSFLSLNVMMKFLIMSLLLSFALGVEMERLSFFRLVNADRFIQIRM
jgi:hypothetical protein